MHLTLLQSGNPTVRRKYPPKCKQLKDNQVFFGYQYFNESLCIWALGFYFCPSHTGLPLSLKQANLAVPQCFCTICAHLPCPLFAVLPPFLHSSLCPITIPLHPITCNSLAPCPALFFLVQTLFYIFIHCLFTVTWAVTISGLCFTFCHHLEECLQIRKRSVYTFLISEWISDRGKKSSHWLGNEEY